MSPDQESTSRAQSLDEALDHYKRNVGDELDRIFDEATIQAAKTKTRERKDGPRLEITNYGRIGQMILPPGWTEAQQPAGETDKRRFREFTPPDKPNVKICFFFRGHRVADEVAKAFQAVLEKPAHVVTSAEFAAVAEVVRDKTPSDTFKLLVAATRDVNQKRVLLVEGTYSESNDDVHALHIDGDGAGSIIQEVYFQAPKKEYPLHFAEVSTAFKSIQWK